jgi:hypothetical protein
MRLEGHAEEVHARAIVEASGLARDDVKRAGEQGEHAEALYHERLEHHYEELRESIYAELFAEERLRPYRP